MIYVGYQGVGKTTFCGKKKSDYLMCEFCGEIYKENENE